jgi:hypothetical protein
MFSKNFYEIDEVVASLVASLFRQAPIETLFWTKELIDSSATSYLIEALVLVYTLKFGANRLEYINVLSGVVLRKMWSEYDIMRATYLLTLIDSGCKSHAILDYLADKRQQGAPKDIQEVSQEWLGRPSRAFDVAMHYLMEVADATEESLAPLELPRLPSALKVMFNEIGRRRRFFAISNRDLYGSCRRGFMMVTESTDNLLIKAHKTYNDSIIWRDAPDPTKAYSNDDTEVLEWERQIGEIFPDDIPDEWSKEEREKSHGIGCLNANDDINCMKWLEMHLGVKDVRFDASISYPDVLPNSLYII